MTEIKENQPKKKRPPRNAASTKLKAVRVKSGITQGKLAEMADVNVRVLQHYEQGSKKLDLARLDTILSIALALNTPIEVIIEDPNTINLIERYKKAGL